MDTLTPDFKPKAFWQRPEGKTGLIIPALIAVVAFWFWGRIVPFVLSTVEDTFWLVLYSILLAAMLYMVFSKDFRRFVFYLYKSVMRWITKWFVEIDPIGILKTYKSRVEEKLTEMESAIGGLRGQAQELMRAIQTKMKDFNKSMGLLQQANKNPQESANARVIALESKQVTRLETLINKLRGDYENLMKIIAVLTKYHEVSSDAVIDMGNEIETREFEMKMAKKTHSAMSAAFGILKGLPDEKEMQQMALDELEQRYTQQMGEVEQMLDMTKGIVFSANLEQGVNVDNALKKLEEWQRSGGFVANGKIDKKQLFNVTPVAELPPAPGMPIQLPVRRPEEVKVRPAAPGDDYTDLLSKL